jgi:hypothetical protein
LPEWEEVLEECAEDCREDYVKEIFKEVCGERGEHCWRPRRRAQKNRYEWIQKLIDAGVPDGRARLILYVISRYLVNVLGMSPEEAQREIEIFLENSCSKHGKCGGIYKSWIRSVIRGVSRGGWRPWSLERMKREDPQLYETVKSVLGELQE